MVELSKVVSAGVGPIIVISACGLLCNTYYNRIANVITRLRAFHRERLAEQTLLDRETDDALRVKRHELLTMLSAQTDSLMRRVRLLRRTLYCLLFTIASLIICSLSLGLAVFVPPLIYLAITMFIVGLTVLLFGLGFAALDLKLSLDPVVLETRFVTGRLRKGNRV